jgi:pyruvate/2-oxoglutarate dehydrogenase complex dihydrolipoamide dehydrogenase (E3) component
MNSTENASSTHSSRKLASEEYDLVILGSGTGSKLIAWTFAGQGQRVAVVERKYIGGSCPNIACLPSKHIIHTAQVASYVRKSEEFASQGMASKLICLLCATENARWYPV